VEEPDRPATPSRPRSLSKITQPITAPPTMRAVDRGSGGSRAVVLGSPRARRNRFLAHQPRYCTHRRVTRASNSPAASRYAATRVLYRVQGACPCADAAPFTGWRRLGHISPRSRSRPIRTLRRLGSSSQGVRSRRKDAGRRTRRRGAKGRESRLILAPAGFLDAHLVRVLQPGPTPRLVCGHSAACRRVGGDASERPSARR
jgi:hypothetical protein